MSNELTKMDGSIIEKVVVGGDLAQLNPAERMKYYAAVCESAGLNPLTQPFGYIKLNGKLQLYALKACTDQLRNIHHVSVSAIEGKTVGELYVVTCKVQDREGRTDVSTGAVAIGGLRGDALGNAIMKAETKAKRRATLSLCGLGLLDETEAETIVGADIKPANIDVNPTQPQPTSGEDEKRAKTIESNVAKLRTAPDVDTLNKMRDWLTSKGSIPADIATRYDTAYRDRMLELSPAEPAPEREPGWEEEEEPAAV